MAKRALAAGSQKKGTSTAPKKSKSIDELKWKRIDDDIDDNGNDDGIFYGLEEIDGVEIENDAGMVNFLVNEDTEIENHEANERPQKAAKKAKKETKPKQSEDLQSVSFKALEALPAEIKTLNNWPQDLGPTIFTALKACEFETPTEIQLQTIPEILEGKDVIGKAATGSGKTLAFGLPILHAFVEDPRSPKAVIIAPTRELAHQIRDHMNKVVEKCLLPVKTCGFVALTGGLAIQKQKRLLESNPVAIVGTPGRLLEILEQMSSAEREAYQKVEKLVVDEADRLVQNQSFEEVDQILNKIGRPSKELRRQTLVFSATFEPELWNNLSKKRRKHLPDIRQVMEEKLGMRRDASYVDVDPKAVVASNIVQAVIECPAMEKDLFLYYFTLLYPGKSIIFVNSIHAVKRIAPLLKELGLEAFGVHSDMIQKQRLRSLDRFKASSKGLLVATDVAARGLDVPQVDHVLHYHVPRSGDMYVHRSGRTARAGHEGVSVVLCAPDEAAALVKLRKLVTSALRTMEVDFDVLEQLRVRVSLAKQIADGQSSSAHKGKSDSWLDQAAADLDIELSDDEKLAIISNKPKKKVQNQQAKNQEVNLKALRAELQDLLQKRIMPNRKYLTSGSNLAHAMVENPDAIIPGKRSVTALEELKVTKKSENPSAQKKSAEVESAKARSAKAEPGNKPVNKSARKHAEKLSKSQEPPAKKAKVESKVAKKPVERVEGENIKSAAKKALKNGARSKDGATTTDELRKSPNKPSNKKQNKPNKKQQAKKDSPFQAYKKPLAPGEIREKLPAKPRKGKTMSMNLGSVEALTFGETE